MGHIVFVATANDGATEKDCLFLELSFSLKEIKINIERFFFFKKNMLKKKSIPSQPAFPPRVGAAGIQSRRSGGLSLSSGPAMSSLFHGVPPLPVPIGLKDSRTVSLFSFNYSCPHHSS